MNHDTDFNEKQRAGYQKEYKGWSVVGGWRAGNVGVNKDVVLDLTLKAYFRSTWYIRYQKTQEVN